MLCSSGIKVPSHRFPRNLQRRIQWLQSLNMETLQSNKIDNLRVCHKHFKEEDYSCAPKIRVLKSNAIPSMANQSIVEKNNNVLNVINTATTVLLHNTLKNSTVQNQQLETEVNDTNV